MKYVLVLCPKMAHNVLQLGGRFNAAKPLIINGIEIPCYVLEDGQRVIVQRGLYKALGLTRGGGSEKYKKFGGGARLVSFLDQNSLIPLFDGDFGAVLSNPVVFEVNKTVHYGYEATLLQEIKIKWTQIEKS